MDGRRLDLGVRLLEIDREDAGPAPALADYRPGPTAHAPFVRHVADWVGDLVGERLREVDRPAMSLDGRLVDDIYFTVDLDGLARALPAEEARRTAAEAAEAARREGDAGVLDDRHDLLAASLEEASRANHGDTFHGRFIAPMCAKIHPGGAAAVPAALRRKVWMPLFYPRTLERAAAGAPTGFHPRRPFHTVEPGGMGEVVEALLARIRSAAGARVMTVGRLVRAARAGGGTTALAFDSGVVRSVRRPVIGVGAEEAFAAVGARYAPERVPMVIAWAEVDEDDLLGPAEPHPHPRPRGPGLPRQPRRRGRPGDAGAGAGAAPRHPRRRRRGRRDRHPARHRPRAPRRAGAGGAPPHRPRADRPLARERRRVRARPRRVRRGRARRRDRGRRDRLRGRLVQRTGDPGPAGRGDDGMTLTPAALDDYARTYYLSDEIADIDIEERAQRLSAPRVAAAVGDARRVLDMGYGTGEMAAELLGRGLAAEVVEGSPLLADRARAEHPGLVVHQAMFEDFDPGPVYDAVLALHVMEHVDAPRDLMARVRGWLAPGGALVVVVPNRHSLHRRLAVLMGIQGELDDLSPRDHLVGHRRVYGLDTLGEDLRAAGFAVQEEFGFTLKTVPNAMMLDWPPDLMDALTAISPDLPAGLLANIGVRAVAVA